LFLAATLVPAITSDWEKIGYAKKRFSHLGKRVALGKMGRTYKELHFKNWSHLENNGSYA